MPSIWQDPTKSIPRSDPKVRRIDFDKNDIGARKSHTNNTVHKATEQGIQHVGKT